VEANEVAHLMGHEMVEDALLPPSNVNLIGLARAERPDEHGASITGNARHPLEDRWPARETAGKLQGLPGVFAELMGESFVHAGQVIISSKTATVKLSAVRFAY
jgi:hypothetical protein